MESSEELDTISILWKVAEVKGEIRSNMVAETEKHVGSTSMTPGFGISVVAPTLALDSDVEPVEGLVLGLNEPVTRMARELVVKLGPEPEVSE